MSLYLFQISKKSFSKCIFRNFNTKGIQGSGKKYCTFCAGSNHGSEAGCFSMVNDQLRHVYATPSMKYCDGCFEKVKKKLHHNSKLCPLRPQLMEAYRRGQLKPLGIFKAYVEKQNPSNKWLLSKLEHDMYLMGITMACMESPDEINRHKERKRAQSLIQRSSSS